MALFAAAALAGFAVLAIEILGVHWLAPWFGTSALVWSNQIGVVLLAMAIGGWMGGKATRRVSQPLKLGGGLLLAAGFFVGLSLWLMPLVANALLPSHLLLDEAATIFLGGSLGTALLFFAPPVFLLAMLSPLLIEARAQTLGNGTDQGRAGSAAGSIAAAGTLGSLFGVFGSSLVAIPLLGVRWTLAATSIALVVAGFLLLRSSAQAKHNAPRASNLTALLLLLPGLLLFAKEDPAITANLPVGAKVLNVTETAMQRLRVIEFESGERWLQMNEGLDSYQSKWSAQQSPWMGGYYDLFALAPIYAQCEARLQDASSLPNQIEFWILGYAAGTAIHPISEVLKDHPWRATGVEIDAELRAVTNEWLPLPDELLRHVHLVDGGDARACLHAAPDTLDFVLLDAYTNQFEIPLHLATEEFFQEVYDHLRPGGVLAINLGTSEQAGSSLGFADAVRAGLCRIFENHVKLHKVARSRNVVAFARKGKPIPSVEELILQLPEGLPASLGASLLPGQTLIGAPEGLPVRLRDDRNPLALAQARLWLGGAKK